MKGSIVTRLDKISRHMPPTWDDLTRVMLNAGERLNQVEIDAYLAHIRGDASPTQATLWDEWIERNRPRIWAVWDARFPGWQDAPFWSEAGEQEKESKSEIAE